MALVGPAMMMLLLAIMALHVVVKSSLRAEDSWVQGGRAVGRRRSELLEWYKADPKADPGKRPGATGSSAVRSSKAASADAVGGGMIEGKPWGMQLPGVAREAEAPVNQFGLHKYTLDDGYVQWRKEPWFWEVRDGEQRRLPGVNIQSSYPMDVFPIGEMAETIDHPFEDR
eukprot:757013-Hanusia_phi.AAC.4